MEFALALPVLLLVFAGIVDFGFLFRDWEVVTNAAREGARLAVLPGYESTRVQTRIQSYLNAGQVNVTVSAVCPSSPGAATVSCYNYEPGNLVLDSGNSIRVVRVTVVVRRQFPLIGPISRLVGSAGFAAINLVGVSEMRVEAPESGGGS